MLARLNPADCLQVAAASKRDCWLVYSLPSLAADLRHVPTLGAAQAVLAGVSIPAARAAAVKATARSLSPEQTDGLLAEKHRRPRILDRPQALVHAGILDDVCMRQLLATRTEQSDQEAAAQWHGVLHM